MFQHANDCKFEVSQSFRKIFYTLDACCSQSVFFLNYFLFIIIFFMHVVDKVCLFCLFIFGEGGRFFASFET